MKYIKNTLLRSLLTAVMILAGIQTFAQVKVSGIVKDGDGQPVVGAVVMVEGSTSVGTTTDVDGRYTLTIPIVYAKHLYVHDTMFTNGTINITSGGYLHITTAVDASTVDFKVGCALYLEGSLDVRDYEPVWSNATYNKGAAALNVHRAFIPAAHDCFYGCTMMEGSTIDLSNRTTPLPLTSVFTDTGRKTLSFEDGASVQIRIKNGTFPGENVKIISWDSPPEGVSFVPERVDCKLLVEADGLYLQRVGTMVILL